MAQRWTSRNVTLGLFWLVISIRRRKWSCCQDGMNPKKKKENIRAWKVQTQTPTFPLAWSLCDQSSDRVSHLHVILSNLHTAELIYSHRLTIMMSPTCALIFCTKFTRCYGKSSKWCISSFCSSSLAVKLLFFCQTEVHTWQNGCPRKQMSMLYLLYL